MNHLPLNPTEITQENKKLSKSDILKRKNKTIKKRMAQRDAEVNNQRFNVKSMLHSMSQDDDSDDDLVDFSPPSPPVVQQKPVQNANQEMNTYNPYVDVETSKNEEDEVVNPEGFRSLDGNMNQAMYQQYVPYYTNTGDQQSLDGPKDKLLEKLNYMIHLLEEQKEEKTGHVTEELILYSFLGVFVIFVVDSFARVGKYVR